MCASNVITILRAVAAPKPRETAYSATGYPRFPHDDNAGGLNGSTQHSPEVLSAGVSMAKFVRER